VETEIIPNGTYLGKNTTAKYLRVEISIVGNKSVKCCFCKIRYTYYSCIWWLLCINDGKNTNHIIYLCQVIRFERSYLVKSTLYAKTAYYTGNTEVLLPGIPLEFDLENIEYSSYFYIICN